MSIPRLFRFGWIAVALILFSSPRPAAAVIRQAPAPRQASADSLGGVGAAFLIANAAGVAEVNPAIAYDSGHQEYLAVWYDNLSSNPTIKGQRISLKGSLIGYPFTISFGSLTASPDDYRPRVAYDDQADNFLVVWEKYDAATGYSIRGCLLNWNGDLSSTAYDIAIETAGGSSYHPSRPAVAYSHEADKYLVAWAESSQIDPYYNNIYGRSITSTGSLGSGLINIYQSTSTFTLSNPDLAYNPLTDQFLVVWERYDPGASVTDICGRRVSGDGTSPLANAFFVALFTTSSTAPSVTALPVSPLGEYLVVYEEDFGIDHDILGQVVGYDGTISPDHTKITESPGVDDTQPTVAASPSRGAYLVAWRQITVPSLGMSSIFSREETATGSLNDQILNLGGIVAGRPRLAAGAQGDFGMVYHDVNLSLDWGTYGWVVGSRVYLPILIR